MAASVIIPPRCYSCGVIVFGDDGLCGKCASEIKHISRPLCMICGVPFLYEQYENAICETCSHKKPYYSMARCAIVYNQIASKIISSFKYSDKTGNLNLIDSLLKSCTSECLQGVDYIAPVPIHSFKLLKRKYNQSALIAAKIAKGSEIEFVPTLLVKTRQTKPQAVLSDVERRKNVRNSFALNKRYFNNIQGKTILLVDDVFTTGSTVNECAKVLIKSGAYRVNVITVARTMLEK